MPDLKEEKYNFVKRILARLTKIKNKSFSDAVQNIIKAFEDKALQTNSFFTKNLGRVDLEQKNKLVTIFEKAKTPQSSNELEHNIIKWVLINTGGKSSSDEDSDNEWLFNDKKVIRSNLFTDVTRNKKRLKNYFTQLEALENDFEETNKINNNNNRDEEKYYQLVLAILCLFILEKKNIFIKLAQEEAARGKAVRGKAVREEAVREKTAQEEAAREEATRENKSPLVDPESNSKNISHPSSPNLQKKENKNLPLEAEKGLLPISSQEMMTKKVSDEIAHQKDNSLTTQLTNSGYTPLHSETSIDDNPTKLDKDNENETIEHRLNSPTQKIK